jgi:transcriptional regulator with XRE-family HTH domain
MSEYQTKQDKIVSSRLREERERLRMSQEDLAHAIGVNVRTVNRWENSGYTGTKGKRLAGLGMDMGYIMSEHGIMDPPMEYRTGFSGPEKALLRHYRICDELDRRAVDQLLESLARKAL